MVRNLLGSLVKRMRKLVFSMNEEPARQVDEYVLEHLLFYHGLVGSSPENQRSFRDVRDDINQAVQNSNSLQMGVALKLPPLWWEDKLRAIFDEIVAREGSERAVIILHPQLADDTWRARLDPLGHPDWHVRANAASILALLQARKTTPRMARSLRDSASTAKSAFCHIAYALGKMGAEQSRSVLSEFLEDEEPWFRVDAAGALAYWPVAIVGDTLMGSMLSYNELSDYMAVAIARQHKPIDFLRETHSYSRQGACAMVLALLEASCQTFGSEAIADNKLSQCVAPVIELAQSEPTPLSLRAALALIDWSEKHGGQDDETTPDHEQLQAVCQKLTTGGATEGTVLDHLQSARSKSSQESAQLRQAIGLAGDLKMRQAVPHLLKLLALDDPLLDATIEALGRIGETAAVEPLIDLSNKLVSMTKRTAMPLSKQPVDEEDVSGSKSYWQVLKALGATYSAEAIKYLVEAAADYAPDKRDQALVSLVRLCERVAGSSPGPDGESGAPPAGLQSQIREAITRALGDPSPPVRATALKGVAALVDAESMPEVVKLTDSAEISVRRQAFATLDSLWRHGFGNAIKQAGEERMRGHSKTHWAKQFSDFLAADRAGNPAR